MSSGIRTIDPLGLAHQSLNDFWNVIVGMIITAILVYLRRFVREIVGGIAFGMGSGTFYLSAWAWSIMIRYEIPVGIELANTYPVGVASYLGYHIAIWTGFLIVGLYMAGGGIVAARPRSKAATLVLRYLFRKKENPFVKAWNNKMRYIDAWIDVLIPRFLRSS